MAAGYLAKYATKSTEVTGHRSPRLTADTIGNYADPDGDHIARLIDACWRLGRPTHTPTPLSDRPRPDRSDPAYAHDGPAPAAARPPGWPPAHTAPARQTRPRLTPTCQNPAQSNPYAGLRRWAHMLGFGGHFLTKADAAAPPSATCATSASNSAATTRTRPTTTPASSAPPTT